MKNVILILGVLFLTLNACKKDELYEGPYDQVEPVEEVDTTAWDSDYAIGGTIPTNTGGSGNPLVGTQWVLTKYVSAFATEHPNDTLTFTSNTTYTLNGGSERNYQLAGITSSTNKELSLYYFSPFGGSHYSAQVGLYFVDDGEINNTEFEDIQNSNNTIRAWFIKI